MANSIKHSSEISSVGCGRAIDHMLGSRPQDFSCSGIVKPQFDFSQALKELRGGKPVERAGWNGKKMFLVMVQPPQSACPSELMYDISLAYMPTKYKLLPFIAMKTADECLVPWLAPQTDILAQDWSLSDEMQNPV